MPSSSEWIPVGALGDAFARDANVLPVVTTLAGTSVYLHLADKRVYGLDFLSPSQLRFRADGSGAAPRAETTNYTATEVRPGILLIAFRWPNRRASAVCVVLDNVLNIATLVLGQLPSRREAEEPLLSRIERGAELTSVGAEILSASLNHAMTGDTPRHLDTCELVGRRVEYTYSPSERYEHIYLNEKFYTWHCLEGSEKGLADTDRCHYRRIARDLYLFVWCEKIVPTLGVVLLDLAQLRTTGQILGYRGFDFGAVTSFPVGARARVLQEVDR